MKDQQQHDYERKEGKMNFHANSENGTAISLGQFTKLYLISQSESFFCKNLKKNEGKLSFA